MKERPKRETEVGKVVPFSVIAVYTTIFERGGKTYHKSPSGHALELSKEHTSWRSISDTLVDIPDTEKVKIVDVIEPPTL